MGHEGQALEETFAGMLGNGREAPIVDIHVCIAPTQAWIGAHWAQWTSATALSRVFALSLATTAILMLRSSLAWH